MFIFLSLFIVAALYGIKFSPLKINRPEYMTDYMSIDKTSSIKGIFIIIVFFSHFNSYVTFRSGSDLLFADIIHKIGQAMVTLFLFYSRFGVMESIKKKKTAYIKKIPVSRVLATLFRFDIAIILFAAVELLLKKPVGIGQFLLSLVAWDAVGNSNWYIFAILVSYMATYIAFILFGRKEKYYLPAFVATLLIAAFVLSFGYFKIKPSYWFDTVIIYALGVWWSLLRDKIEKLLNKNIFIYLAFLIISVAGTAYLITLKNRSFITQELYMFFFTAAVVLFTMRVSIDNKLLRFFGKHLFGVYILQRIPMMIFYHDGVNIYVYFIVCFAVTAAIAPLFDKLTGKAWNYLLSLLPSQSEKKLNNA